jgi:hypothetical protein
MKRKKNCDIDDSAVLTKGAGDMANMTNMA